MFRQAATQMTRRAIAARVPRRNFTVTERFTKEEQAAERDFINKEERSLLNNLAQLQKKKQDLKTTEDLSSCSNLLIKHNVEPKPDLVADLLQWKAQ